MEYIQIQAIPLPRPNTTLPPGAAFAARLAGNRPADTVELRYHKSNGQLHCYLGLPASISVGRAAQILADEGYLATTGAPPQGGSATYLLQRHLNETVQGSSVQFCPSAIESTPQRHLALFHALCHSRAGTGLSLFLRKESLPAALTAAAKGQPALAEMTHAPCLYRVALCAYGADAAMVAEEAAYSMSGLNVAPITPTPLSPDPLFRLLDGNPMNCRHNTLAPIAGYFYPDELANMTAMVSAASPALECGLQYNFDTIPGEPMKYPQESPELLIGTDAHGKPIYLPFSRLKHNTCLVAPIGAGKGNFLFSMITQLRKAEIPTLVLEASKQEYHYLQRILPQMQTWRPEGGSFLLNPFELPTGLTLSQYRPSLHQMMRTVFAMPSPLDDYFNQTVELCYAKYGYRESSRQGDPGTIPWGMHEFIMEFNGYLASCGYSQKTKNDMTQAGMGRLQAPLNENAQIYDTIRSVPMDMLTKGLNLLQLNDLTSVAAKQMFATMVLIALSAYLKTQLAHSTPDGKPRLVVILEESHQLLRAVKDKSGEANSFAEDFLGLMLTLRSVGCSFVLSTQSTDLLPLEFLKSCGNRIFMGDALSQFTVANSVVKLDDAAREHLYLLKPGQGLLTTRGLSRPYFFQTANIIDKILQPTTLTPQNQWLNQNRDEMTQVFGACSQCSAKGSCSLASRQEAQQKAMQLYALFGAKLDAAFSIKDAPQRESAIQKCYSSVLGMLAPLPDTVRICAQIQFLRLFNRRGNHILPIHKTRQDMEKLIQTMKKGANGYGF